MIDPMLGHNIIFFKVSNIGVSVFTPLIQNSILSPSHTISQEGIKGIQIEKEEVKLSLFADDLILYIKNPKDSTKKNTRTDQ